jgi:hypothetical protein
MTIKDKEELSKMLGTESIHTLEKSKLEIKNVYASKNIIIAECVVAGINMIFNVYQKSGAYNKLTVYAIVYECDNLIENTNLTKLLRSLETFEKIFSIK